jgi:multidrug resistance efflux pump
MKRLVPLVVIAALAGVYWYVNRPPTSLVLTGIVTTDPVIVSPQIMGRLDQMMVKEGDSVTKNQLIAVLSPDELRQDRAFYSYTAGGVDAQVREGEAALRWQERQNADQVAQAEANLAATESQKAASEAEMENARTSLERMRNLLKNGVATPEQLDSAQTAYTVAQQKVAAFAKQIEAQKAAVALAKTDAEQITVRRNQLNTYRQQSAAATAQQKKADVRLGYSELRSPIDGIINVRAARGGEVVSSGQPVVTIVDPDDLWVRADVEETYIDRIKLGDTLTVRLPSGEERPGKVIYKGVDAGFATQRDVSRTKRDIKTFEIRLRLDNTDRKLALGMTAYVLLPLQSA